MGSLPPSGVLNVLSALLLGAAGAATWLLPRPRTSARLFGSIAILWAASILCANLGTVASTEATARRLFLATVAWLAPLSLLLVRFGTSFPRGAGRSPVSVLAAIAAAAPGVILAPLMILRPDLVLRGVVRLADGRWAPIYGDANGWLVAVPFVLAFAVASVSLSVQSRRAESGSMRAQSGLLAVALGTYLVYLSPGNLLFYVTTPGATPLVIGFRVAFACGTAAAVLLLVLVRKSGIPHRNILAAVLVGAFGVGLLENLSFATGNESVLGIRVYETLGLWRLLSVALILYAIARYQLFDIDLKVARGLKTGAYALAVFLAFVVVSEAIEALFVTNLGEFAGVGAALVVALALRPVEKRAGLLIERKVGADVHDRKREVYRAQLEEALAKDNISRDEEVWLSTLRSTLGISEREHREILEEIRAPMAATAGA